MVDERSLHGTRTVKRFAALDCGTNTLRLLVADLDSATGRQMSLDRRSTVVRLGQGVDRTGRFAAEALQRTFTTLEEYADVVAGFDVDAVRFVATSAARDVANRDAFLTGVRARIGVDAEIISGGEEARLSYDGATRQLSAHPEIARPVAVLDIGGGSTELVMPGGDGAVPGGSGEIRAISLDVGSVRLTERHLHSDPPTADEVAAAVADVETALDTVDLPLAAIGSLIGVAGSATTMAAMVLDLPEFDSERVHLARLAIPDVEAAVRRMVAMTVAERRALPFMQPDRADVMGAGALVLACVIRRVGLPDLLVSTSDILDGIAWSMA